MREIKFRGKIAGGDYTCEDGWVYGNLTGSPIHLYIQEVKDLGHDLYILPNTEVVPKSIGQYTGLRDKTEKEIYEGDIVHLDSWSPYAMQICFIAGAFCMANEKGEYLGDIYHIQNGGINQCTILGNIYDNFELLK